MITNSVELFNYNKEGEKKCKISIVKKDSKSHVVFRIESIVHDENYKEHIDLICEFDVHWNSLLRFVKSCYMSHIK